MTDAVRDAAGRQFLLAAVALLALAALAVLVSRRIIRPLETVTAAIVAARDEPMPAPVAVQGPREVALLASEFNAMIEARLDYEAQLTDRALHDDLTQLPNRALLRDRLERSIRGAGADATLAVLFLDLDRFKLVNDSLGHPAGDALLQSVATRLAAAARPQDTLARFGGDEFVVVCEDVGGAPGAVEIARALEAALDAPFTVAGTEVNVSATIGIALTADSSANPDELVREADIAMYQAKDSTRPWELWDDDLHAAERPPPRSSSRISGPRSRIVSSSSTTSRSGTSRTGRSSAPRRSCAGTIPGSGGSRRASSSSSPRNRARSARSASTCSTTRVRLAGDLQPGRPPTSPSRSTSPSVSCDELLVANVAAALRAAGLAPGVAVPRAHGVGAV